MKGQVAKCHLGTPALVAAESLHRVRFGAHKMVTRPWTKMTTDLGKLSNTRVLVQVNLTGDSSHANKKPEANKKK
jgi:hypothetical protein